MAIDSVEISNEAQRRDVERLNHAHDFDKLIALSIEYRHKRVQQMKELAWTERLIEEVDDRLDAITAQLAAGR